MRNESKDNPVFEELKGKRIDASTERFNDVMVQGYGKLDGLKVVQRLDLALNALCLAGALLDATSGDEIAAGLRSMSRGPLDAAVEMAAIDAALEKPGDDLVKLLEGAYAECDQCGKCEWCLPDVQVPEPAKGADEHIHSLKRMLEDAGFKVTVMSEVFGRRGND